MFTQALTDLEAIEAAEAMSDAQPRDVWLRDQLIQRFEARRQQA